MLPAPGVHHVRGGGGRGQHVLEHQRQAEQHGQEGPHLAAHPRRLAAHDLDDLHHVLLGAHRLRALPALGAGQAGPARERSSHRRGVSVRGVQGHQDIVGDMGV